MRYTWPGNVRQLQNVIRNIVVLNDETKLSIAHLPDPITRVEKKMPRNVTQVTPPPAHPNPVEHEFAQTLYQSHIHNEENLKPNSIRPMWQIERETIQNAIDYCDGNVLNAAVLLELSPSTVYRKKQAWESEDEQNTA